MVRPQALPSSVEASIALDQESAFDRAMGWLALYVPTVGTSVTLHVALVLLAAFLIPFATERPPEFGPIRSAIDPPKAPTVGKRRPRLALPDTLQHLRPEPQYNIRQGDLKIRGIGQDPLMEHIAVIGIGADRVGGGPLTFGGPEDGAPFRPPPGEEMHEARVVYLVDRSGSMTDSLDYVKFELKERLAELDESVEFHIIFYSSGPPVEMPTRRLVPATERNKRRAFTFIDEVIARGETDPSRGFERAFAAQPGVIYFLTDGEFDKAVVGQVRGLNAGGKVAVHTIQFLYTGQAETLLRQIAKENGGRYMFISEADLALLGT